MTTKILSAIFFASILCSVASAQVGDNRDSKLFQDLATEGKGDVRIQDWWHLIPDATNPHTISPACDPRRLEEAALAKKITTAEYFKILQSYFSKCQRELTSVTGVGAYVEFSRFQYLFLQNPQIKKFTVKLADGSIVPAILAMKQDPRPRPLVVIRCGVFCSAAQTTSMMSYMIHMFDQSPFNIIFLANQTGMDYIRANKKVSLGGWSEGFETLMVGKWMQEKWEHRDRISSVHMMGISLGGNAAFFGASFNDKYSLDSGKKIFSSVAAICPVVSLKPTLDHLFGTQLVGRVFAKNSREHFSEAREYLNDVPDLISDSLIPKDRRDMPEFIANLASTSLQRRGIASTTSSFFKSNNFWNVKQEVKTPLLVWASKDDMVVNNKLNAQVVADDNVYEKSSNATVLNLKYGNHCAFGSAYGFQAAAAVLRTFVLTHSPEFKETYVTQEMPWNGSVPGLGLGGVHAEQSFHFTSKSGQVRVTFKVFDPYGGEDCRLANTFGAAASCYRDYNYSIPVESLKAVGARVPQNEVEAQALTREFNTKVEFRTGAKPLTGTKMSTNVKLQWKPFFD